MLVHTDNHDNNHKFMINLKNWKKPTHQCKHINDQGIREPRTHVLFLSLISSRHMLHLIAPVSNSIRESQYHASKAHNQQSHTTYSLCLI